MSEELHKQMSQAGDTMKKAIAHLETELLKIRAGKASPQMFEGLTVDYYGSPTPLNQVGNVSVADARTITIQPWEKNMIQPIERAIMAANLGVTPQNDGTMIRIFMPPLTEERRKEIVKRVHAEAEHSRVAVRNIRRDTIEQLKKLKKEGLSEDLVVDAEQKVQDLTNSFIAQIEKHVQAKEKEIMSI